ncbi:MAG: ribosome silencing factor [Candidatus Bipolaricaulia bacterium]
MGARRSNTNTDLETWEITQLRQVVQLIEEKYGQNTVVLDMRAVSVPTRYFVITEAEGPKQVKAIVDHLIEHYPKEHLLHREGVKGRNWVVLDYNDFIVHVFQRETREFYDLEGLWGEWELDVDHVSDKQRDPSRRKRGDKHDG